MIMVTLMSLRSSLLLSAPIGSTTSVVTSNAVASAVYQWLPSVVTTGVSTGVLGLGVVAGSFVFSGVPSLVTSALMFRGCVGESVDIVGTWIGSGILGGLGGCVYVGTGGVVTGSDVSSVSSADSMSLRVLLNQHWSRACVSAGGLGLMGDDRFLWGLSEGIVQLVMTGLGSGVCSGVGGVSSGTGVSSGRFVVG